jgi:hypothetical protein
VSDDETEYYDDNREPLWTTRDRIRPEVAKAYADLERLLGEYASACDWRNTDVKLAMERLIESRTWANRELERK